MSPTTAFHITAKPTGALCNMRCDYCYFLCKAKTLQSCHKMTDSTLENFIKQYINAQTTDTIFFTWHGGEPTLLGLDFFKKVIELQSKHCPAGKYIENDLQTNGVLIDKEWCKFLKENHFLVGLSVDGDEHSNIYRKDVSQKSVLSSVIRASELLRYYDIPFNTLTVVSNVNSKRPLETYQFLKDVIGSRHMQFIPLVEVKNYQNTAPLHWPENIEVEEFSVTPSDWGNFLLTIFGKWYEEDLGRVYIYLFENFLSLWLGQRALMCVFDQKCGHAMSLDCDGSVYACDHFSYPEYCYGNINQQSLSKIISSDPKGSFERLKSALPQTCAECKWKSKCHGECPKKRFTKAPNGQTGLNYLCEGYKIFFEGIDNRMKSLAKRYLEFENEKK